MTHVFAVKLTLLNQRSGFILAQPLLVFILHIQELLMFFFFGKRFLHSLLNVCGLNWEEEEEEQKIEGEGEKRAGSFGMIAKIRMTYNFSRD